MNIDSAFNNTFDVWHMPLQHLNIILRSSCSRIVRVSVLGGGEVAPLPGLLQPLLLQQRGHQVHPAARVLPRPAHPAGGWSQGGGDHVLWSDEDLGLEADRGCDTGWTSAAQHL